MKKLLLLAFGVLLVLPVYAAENRLRFTESGKHLYYDSKLLNENYFMKYLDMTPDAENTDELIIENATKTACTLYFQIKPPAVSAYADQLLNNIDMTISIDGNLVYSGKAKGLDYNSSGVNLQDTVEVGKYFANQVSKMVVTTKLAGDYENPGEDDTAVIDWAFYGQCDDPVKPDDPTPEPEPEPEPTPAPEKEVIKILPKPQTGISTNVIIYMSAVFTAAIILLIVFILDKKRKNKEN